MAFKPGDKKPDNSGRKKGVRNKFSISSVRKLLEKREIDPIEKILGLMSDLKPSEQVQVYQWFITYLQPKMSEERYDRMLRQMEQQVDASIEESTNNLIELARDN